MQTDTSPSSQSEPWSNEVIPHFLKLHNWGLKGSLGGVMVSKFESKPSLVR